MSAEGLSPVVSAVVKMAEAGVSPVVIETFVECSPAVDPLSGADIIALKQHNVSDEIVTALVKRGAKTHAQQAQQRSEAAARVLAARRPPLGGLDPESYEYFQYYYLQPRATASVYQRLSPYPGPRGYYRQGPLPGFGFRRHGYAHPRY